jgi:hypothetical protein
LYHAHNPKNSVKIRLFKRVLKNHAFYLKSVKNNRKSVEQLAGKQTLMIKILFKARLLQKK